MKYEMRREISVRVKQKHTKRQIAVCNDVCVCVFCVSEKFRKKKNKTKDEERTKHHDSDSFSLHFARGFCRHLSSSRSLHFFFLLFFLFFLLYCYMIPILWPTNSFYPVIITQSWTLTSKLKRLKLCACDRACAVAFLIIAMCCSCKKNNY